MSAPLLACSGRFSPASELSQRCSFSNRLVGSFFSSLFLCATDLALALSFCETELSFLFFDVLLPELADFVEAAVVFLRRYGFNLFPVCGAVSLVSVILLFAVTLTPWFPAANRTKLRRFVLDCFRRRTLFAKDARKRKTKNIEKEPKKRLSALAVAVSPPVEEGKERLRHVRRNGFASAPSFCDLLGLLWGRKAIVVFPQRLWFLCGGLFAVFCFC